MAIASSRPIAAPRDLVDDPRAAPIPGDVRQRLELPVDAITPGTRPVLGVIVTAHGNSPHSTVREVRSLAVPELVFTACLAADDAETRRALLPVAVTLGRLPSIELAHGSRTDTRLEEGAALLEQIRAGALPFLGDRSL